MADRCAQCAAAWQVAETAGHEDQTLEDLLDQLIAEATNLGRCYTDPSQLITGANISHSIGWHDDRLAGANALKASIHQHIQSNYEEDD